MASEWQPHKKCKPIVAETWDQLRGFVQKLFSFTFALVPLSAAAIRVAQFGVKNVLKSLISTLPNDFTI